MRFAGVEVQATVADNLLQRDFAYRPEHGVTLETQAVVGLGAVTALIVARFGLGGRLRRDHHPEALHDADVQRGCRCAHRGVEGTKGSHFDPAVVDAFFKVAPMLRLLLREPEG